VFGVFGGVLGVLGGVLIVFGMMLVWGVFIYYQPYNFISILQLSPPFCVKG
jgi:hypothetical protein